MARTVEFPQPPACSFSPTVNAMRPFEERTQSNDRHPPDGPVHCPTPFTCPLSRVRAGMLVRIKALSAPPAVTRRLREIGLGEEQVIACWSPIQRDLPGMQRASGLSSQLAQMIVVEPLARETTGCADRAECHEREYLFYSGCIGRGGGGLWRLSEL